MEDTVRQRVTKLRCKYRVCLDYLKASFGCIAAAFFTVITIISVQISLIENLPSRLEHPSIEVKISFLFFVFTVYAIATALPVIWRFQLFSGINISALILLCALNAFILYALNLAEFGGKIFFLFVGIVIGWFSEIAWATCIIFVYSFWRNKTYFVVPLICSLTIILLTTYIANLPPEYDGFDVVLVTCISASYILFLSVLMALLHESKLSKTSVMNE